MKIFKLLLLITTGSAILITPSYACQSLTSYSDKRTMSRQDATANLNQFLFETTRSASSPDESVSKINCYLSTAEKNHTRLSGVREALTELGESVIGATTEAQRQEITNKINHSIARDAGSGFIQLPLANGKTTEINLFTDFLEKDCGGVSDNSCADSLQVAKQLWWIAGEYRGYADHLNQDNKVKSLALNLRLDKQWRSYKDDTIKLWPQEVLLNSLTYKPARKGLSAPPSYKLLGLRPSLGLSYLSEQKHRIQPTVNIDLLGLYWWRYGGQENGYRAQPGKGISASLIWDGDDTALGLTYHHSPKWSVTLAHGDDNDIVVSLSFQLAHWLLKR